MASFICLVLITALTFDIEEPLLTEPLLNLSSGQAGGLDQPVDLTEHQVSQLKVATLIPPFGADTIIPLLQFLTSSSSGKGHWV